MISQNPRAAERSPLTAAKPSVAPEVRGHQGSVTSQTAERVRRTPAEKRRAGIFSFPAEAQRRANIVKETSQVNFAQCGADALPVPVKTKTQPRKIKKKKKKKAPLLPPDKLWMARPGLSRRGDGGGEKRWRESKWEPSGRLTKPLAPVLISVERNFRPSRDLHPHPPSVPCHNS